MSQRTVHLMAFRNTLSCYGLQIDTVEVNGSSPFGPIFQLLTGI
jgi:hypothetical protein